MRDIMIKSPSANGAVSVQLVSTETGELISKAEILTPERNEFSLSVDTDQDVSLVWRRLGARNELLHLTSDVEAVTLSDLTQTGPLVDEVYGQEEMLFKNSKQEVSFSHEESEKFEDQIVHEDSESVEAILNFNTLESISGVSEGLPKMRGNSAQKLMDRAVSRKKELVDTIRFTDKFANTLRNFAKKSLQSGSTREAISHSKQFVSSESEKPIPVSIIANSAPLGSLSIGAATDSMPLRYGGWVPYRGHQPIKVRRLFGKVTFEIDGPDTAFDQMPDTSSKLRFTIAAAKRKHVRFLVPRFAKGTRVTFMGDGNSNYEVCFDVEPMDSKLLVIMQSLVVSDAVDARLVEPLVKEAAENILPRLNDRVEEDPWAAILIGLAIRRHNWKIDCSWCLELSKRFSWISDALVLAGWWYSTSAGGRNLKETVECLSRARRLGAPYFAETNAILRDLLVWLSVDAEDVDLKALAKRELSLWRSKIPHQIWAGATFAWAVDRSTLNGQLDMKKDLPIYKGLLSDLIGSTDPNKGQFGGAARSNGRVLSATLTATQDINWTKVELKVECESEADKHVTDFVEFHLHPTFPIPIEKVHMKDGVAIYTFKAWGAFTVGVVTDDGKTRLELDLADLEGGSDLFKSR